MTTTTHPWIGKVYADPDEYFNIQTGETIVAGLRYYVIESARHDPDWDEGRRTEVTMRAVRKNKMAGITVQRWLLPDESQIVTIEDINDRNKRAVARAAYTDPGVAG
jgi:hypothetical protein